jgi:hypothetical protein
VRCRVLNSQFLRIFSDIATRRKKCNIGTELTTDCPNTVCIPPFGQRSIRAVPNEHCPPPTAMNIHTTSLFFLPPSSTPLSTSWPYTTKYLSGYSSRASTFYHFWTLLELCCCFMTTSFATLERGAFRWHWVDSFVVIVLNRDKNYGYIQIRTTYIHATRQCDYYMQINI